MGVIAKYKFNQNVYENFIPELDSNFTDYTITDEIDTDGYTIRTIESDSLPTLLMRFGATTQTDREKSLLKVYECSTSKITNMASMFNNCSSLISVDLSNFNTSQVTSMYAMFFNCSSLTSLDVSNFNTSQVTNMQRMFYNCSSLTSLDVSNFDTSQVTDTDSMFYNCSSLASLDTSNFNTSQVTNMYQMFTHCSSLISLDVSNFDTSQVTTMQSMFYNCQLLTSLDLSNFDTSQVINMSYMFQYCSSLTSLDVSNFDTKNVVDMDYMFFGCSSLISLDLSSFDTGQVITMRGMFQNCSSLVCLDISGFNTSQVVNMTSMFQGCSLLTSLDVSNFDTSQVATMYFMFGDCLSLISLDTSNFVMNRVNDISYMFVGCSSLVSLDISNWKINRLINSMATFTHCYQLSSIGAVYCNSSTINKISSLITTNTKIYYSLPDISELEPYNNIEYVKYIFPTKVQLPPHIQLHSLPDGTCDELDIKTGILTRNVGCFVVDGESTQGIWTSAISYNNTLRMTFIFNDNYSKKPKLSASTITPNNIIVSTEIYDGEHICIEGNGNIRLFLSKNKASTSTEYIQYLRDNPITLYYALETPITEKLILNYNNSCNYSVILPRGTSDNYNVITNEYKQNLDFIPIDGSITFDTATLKDTTVKFSVALSKFEVDTTNVRGSDGIYCDNDLFKYETSDNDYEHAYIENDTTLHIYVNKSRLSSYDQVGFQLYLTNNPFDLYYAMRNSIISYVNYEDLDPEKASWEMLDCTENGSITIESGNMDKTLLLDCMDYVAPTKNRFEIDLLKANTQYTVYAEGVSGRIQLNFGGNIVNFTSGNIYTSGETQLVEFYTDNEIKNLIIIEGDTRNETIEFFEGLKSSENVTVISSNAPFVFGKGGKIQ